MPKTEYDDPLKLVGIKYLTKRIPKKGQGQKLDQEKLRFDLLPWEELEEEVKVLTFGVRKYAANNWKLVEDGERRYRAAAFRHLVAVGKGELRDPETGFSHYAHAICSLRFAQWHAKNGKRSST
jgi:hypothetical protein